MAEEAELLEQKVYRAGSHVMLFYKQRIAVSVAENPAFIDQAMTFHSNRHLQDVGFISICDEYLTFLLFTEATYLPCEQGNTEVIDLL